MHMTDGVTLTVQLSEQMLDRLEALAKRTRRSRNALAAEAITAYVAADVWQEEAVREAVAAADAGAPFYEHEDVMGYLERRAVEGPRVPRPDPVGST